MSFTTAGMGSILLLLINPTPEFLSSLCSLRNSIPTCLGLFGYPVPLVRYANSICYRSLRNYGCYEFRFASLYRKSASGRRVKSDFERSELYELITLFTYSPINFYAVMNTSLFPHPTATKIPYHLKVM